MVRHYISGHFSYAFFKRTSLIKSLTNVSRILTTISDEVSNQHLENDARSFDLHCDLGVKKLSTFVV